MIEPIDLKICSGCTHQNHCGIPASDKHSCYNFWHADTIRWGEFQIKGELCYREKQIGEDTTELLKGKTMDGIKQESGEQREFATGAKRQAASGKGLPSLFPADAYIEICKHFEAGAVLHGARNWEKGLPISCFIDSLERHVAAVKMGKTDEEHYRAIAWNAVCMLSTKVRIEGGILPAELDDLPRYRKISDEHDEIKEIQC